jgi:hypothetical protein
VNCEISLLASLVKKNQIINDSELKKSNFSKPLKPYSCMDLTKSILSNFSIVE